MLVHNIVMLTLVNRLGIEPEAISTGSTVHDELGAGKIDMLNIRMDLEEIFAIEIPQRLMEMKVEAIVQHIELHARIPDRKTA